MSTIRKPYYIFWLFQKNQKGPSCSKFVMDVTNYRTFNFNSGFDKVYKSVFQSDHSFESYRVHGQWQREREMNRQDWKIVHCASREKKFILWLWSLMPAQSEVNKHSRKINVFSRVAHDFFPTGGSKNGYGCSARGNKMHFMTR